MRYRRWAAFASREERIVAYADKRAGQRLESMDARFASWRRRYPDAVEPTPRPDEPSGSRADRLEADVCRAAGVAPGGRPRAWRWTGAGPADRRGARRADDDRRRSPSSGATTSCPRHGRSTASRPRSRPRPGAPLERWLVRGDRNAAAGIVARSQRAGRDAGHVRWRDAGRRRSTRARWCVKNEDRDAFLGAARGRRARQRAGRSSTRASRAPRRPTPKRLADAIAAAGGTVRQFKSPREGALAGWIEAEARERGLAARRRAPPRRWPSGSVGSSARPTPSARQQTRLASMELDKLALYRGGEPITARRRRGARRRGGPGLGLGVHRRGRRAARRARARLARSAARDDRRSRSSWPCSIGGSAS